MEGGEIKAREGVRRGWGEQQGGGMERGWEKGRKKMRKEGNSREKGGSSPEDRLSHLCTVGDGPSPVGPGCAHLTPWGGEGWGECRAFTESRERTVSRAF